MNLQVFSFSESLVDFNQLKLTKGKQRVKTLRFILKVTSASCVKFTPDSSLYSAWRSKGGGGASRPEGGGKFTPAPVTLFSSKTKTINFKFCIVIFFYINSQKLIFIVSCSWMFCWRHHSYFMSHDFLCFLNFFKKC